MAQDPYLHVENNTGLMVQRGGNTNVTSASLSVLTNLDIRDPQEVTFQVFLPPQHGVLCLMDGDCDPANQASGVSTFTQWDLETERLSYHHDGSYELSDCFNVTAKATEKSTAGQRGRRRRSEVRLDIAVPIKIYLESHQRPPTVLTNHPVVVEEGQNVSVTRVNLEVRNHIYSFHQTMTSQCVLVTLFFRWSMKTAGPQTSPSLSSTPHLWAFFKRPPLSMSSRLSMGNSDTHRYNHVCSHFRSITAGQHLCLQPWFVTHLP